MGILSNYLTKQYTAEGTGKPVPKAGIGRYFSLLAMHFWKLVSLNFIFIVFSLPVVTLPAALCGANRVLIKLIREGNVFLWDEFFTEFKASFLKSLPLGLLFGFLLFLGYYFLSLGLTNAQSIYSIAFFSLGLTVILTALIWASYVFVLVPMLALKNRDLLRNALALITLKPLRAICIVAVELVMAFIAYLLFPISLILLVLCWFSFAQYTVCFIANTPVQEHIIAPYEAAQAKKESNSI